MYRNKMLSARKGKATPIVIALLVLVAVGAGVIIMFSRSGLQSHDSFPPFDAYLDNPTNFSGNTYRLEAVIDEQLYYEDGVGRIIAVTPITQDGRLPLFVPDALQANLNVGQRYRMSVSILRGGKIEVTELQKY